MTRKKMVYSVGLTVYIIGVVMFLSGLGAFSSLGVLPQENIDASDSEYMLSESEQKQYELYSTKSVTVQSQSENPAAVGESKQSIFSGFLEVHSVLEWLLIFGGIVGMAIGIYPIRNMEIEAKRRRKELTNF